MDVTLIRSFLEVAATGSFVRASARLYVTQSAVSLRIQRLEDELGKPLFTRSKAGAELTPAGREFERYALSMLKLWEEARQQVGIPEGYTRSLTIGAQYSLWPRLGFGWIDHLRRSEPGISIRAEVGMPDRLTRFLVEGVVQAALTFSPQLRPGLMAERVVEEELVLVSAEPATLDAVAPRYVMVDWGPEFIQAHAIELPALTQPGLTLSLGALATNYVVRTGAAAYLPAGHIKPMLDAGRLHLVPDAPIFPYPVWAVWRDDVSDDLRRTASAALASATSEVERDQGAVIDALSEMSASDDPDILGGREPTR